MKRSFLLVLPISLLVFNSAWPETKSHETREAHEQKFKTLESVSKAFPGTGHVMIELGYRYSVLYHAAKQDNWAFAMYQFEEIEELMERFIHISKERKSQIAAFINTGLEPLEPALRSRDWKKFAGGFDIMRAQCMACHAQNNVGFITVPIPEKHFSPLLK